MKNSDERKRTEGAIGAPSIHAKSKGSSAVGYQGSVEQDMTISRRSSGGNRSSHHLATADLFGSLVTDSRQPTTQKNDAFYGAK